jgi:hypothetical protein
VQILHPRLVFPCITRQIKTFFRLSGVVVFKRQEECTQKCRSENENRQDTLPGETENNRLNPANQKIQGFRLFPKRKFVVI